MATTRRSDRSDNPTRLAERDAVLALLVEEHTPMQVAVALDVAHWTAREIIRDLDREGLITRVARGHYLRLAVGAQAPDRQLRLTRDTLLDYLSQPRRASEIALHIGRSLSIATGHMNRLRQRKLVVRIAFGIYVRADCCTTPPDPMTIQRSSLVLEAVRAQVDREKSVDAICQHLGRSERQVRQYLRRLTQQGVVERVGTRHYRPAQASLFTIAE